ncbi:MAG: NADH-quinone oxidoreductase subunit M [Armatimonadetes bacterium]|nr:NADH-quinone oxidoreductase subunit M [Armatimonadota bacterium]
MIESTGFGLLSLTIFAPFIGALILMFMPEKDVKNIRYAALAFSVVSFVLSLLVLSRFQAGTYHFQMIELVKWIPSLGLNYKVGVDGVSIWLIVLTTFLMVISTIFSFYVDKRVKQYMIFMLMLETAMLGVFLSLDMILFYTFFEASLVPMYFLINIWGGARRQYAAAKFFIYTFAGSIFMLIGIITMHQIYARATGGAGTFDFIAIQSQVASGQFWAKAMQAQPLIFWSFAIAFMVKCPMFPFHTWLPDAHVEAPTAGSVILAGVLLKMGTYGFLRFCLPLFPDAVKTQLIWIMGLAVFGIIYGAIVAAVQPDVKKLVAYSSVAHMGFVIIGIFSLTHEGMMGGAMQQLNHGISTGALFLMIGLLYERRHTRMFKDFGGLKAQMPIYSMLFLIVMLSSVGLPSLNGFVGEFLAMFGLYQASAAGMFGLNIGFPVVAGFGVVLAAVYLLVMFQKVFYGKNENPDNQRLKDIKPWEIAICGVLVLFIFWGGFFPNTFLKPMERSLGAVRQMVLNDEGSRPSYADITMDVNADGALVKVAPREFNGKLQDFQEVSIISPANFYFPAKKPASVQAKLENPHPSSLRSQTLSLGEREIGAAR